MSPDHLYATILIGVGVILSVVKQVSPKVMELLLMLTRPGATIVLLGGVVLLYVKHLRLSALIASILSVMILRGMWTTWPRSYQRSIFLDIGRDHARFDPAKSIDLQFANGSAKHDTPNPFLAPFKGPMLVFPPSAETLAEMSG